MLGVILCAPGCLIDEAQHSTSSDTLNAAVIDQLHNYQPNPDFIEELTNRLIVQDFTVDLYSGDDVTIELYQKLPTYGYELIIFRAHAGFLDLGDDTGDAENGDTYLFTAEEYSLNEKILEQLFDQTVPAEVIEGHPKVFAVNSNFIREGMEGEFGNCAIIMMGCSTARQSDMAEAFISKGASLYIGWSAGVYLDYVDEATLSMVDELIAKGTPIELALHNTVARVGLGQEFNAVPKYYPAAAKEETIHELFK